MAEWRNADHWCGVRRCATALAELGVDRPRPFSRALFVMGHADSVMFHVVEDCVRLHNAKVLGLLPEAEGVMEPEHDVPLALGALARIRTGQHGLAEPVG